MGLSGRRAAPRTGSPSRRSGVLEFCSSIGGENLSIRVLLCARKDGSLERRGGIVGVQERLDHETRPGNYNVSIS